MPLFDFKAARQDGDIVEGQAEAPDNQSLAKRLQAEGQTPINIQAAKASQKASLSNKLGASQRKPKAKELEFLTLELATLLRAGLSLDKALDTLSRLTDHLGLKALVEELSRAIRDGESLSSALAQKPAFFNRFYINMVKAGEAAGALDLTLERLADFQSRSRDLRETLIASLTYPVILLVLALLTLIAMLGFVVPRFKGMFEEAGQDLPLLTQAVVTAGDFVHAWWWALLGSVVFVVFAIRRDLATDTGKARWDAWLLKTPGIGSLIIKVETGRLTRTLSTLLSNGVTLLAGMEIAKEVAGNTQVSDSVTRATTRLRQGEGLAKPLRDAGIFPVLATQLIQVGEETGRLEAMLDQLAEIYEREVRNAIQRMVTLIEPIMILSIGSLISVIILAVVLAMLEANDLAF